VVRGGQPVPVPLSPPQVLTTPLLSLAGRLRLLREPFVAPFRGDESVAAKVRRRLGPEALDYLVEPFVAGVFAGDPERLSARHAFPRAKALEAEHGSFLRGMRAAARRTPGARRGPVSFSFAEGMEELPRTLAAALGDAVHLGAPVHAIRRTEDGWEVRRAGAVPETFDAVVLAMPAHALGRVELDAAGADALLAVSEIPHAPIAVVALGFRREAVAHALDGFGMLVPRVERRRILGTLFTSSLFTGRAPAEHVLLTTFVGGERNPELASLPTDRLTAVVWEELSALLGVRSAPVLVHHAAWERAIPQYVLGHGERRDAMDALEGRNPGLLLAGSFRAGVSVGDTLASGLAAADGVAAHLRSRVPATV
jgi:oxygen-dependent protoporphyrinogen oxidase